jgi:hypothetical protein
MLLRKLKNLNDCRVHFLSPPERLSGPKIRSIQRIGSLREVEEVNREEIVS